MGNLGHSRTQWFTKTWFPGDETAGDFPAMELETGTTGRNLMVYESILDVLACCTELFMRKAGRLKFCAE
jgi:hypothetical protein